MAGRLVVSTILPAPAGSGETFVIYGPDSEDIPEEHARLIGAHAWEDGEHPYLDDESTSSRAEGTPPPRAGKGSSKDEWTAYATEKGVDIPEGTNRDDIIAAVEAAGHSVDPE